MEIQGKSLTGSTALFQLKTELLKKKSNTSSVSSEASLDNVKRIPNLHSRSGNKESSADNNSQSLDEDEDEREAFTRSFEALKRKTAVYEKLSGPISLLEAEEDSVEPKYMVDFEGKFINEFITGLRESGGDVTCTAAKNTLTSRDDTRKVEREEWEKQSLVNEDPEVHYAHVLQGEIRTHGTGFYKFSEDNAKRKKEMDELNQSHKETEELQNQMSSLKSKRKAMMKERLAKIKHRRLGLDISAEANEPEPPIAKPESPPLLERDPNWKRRDVCREWDEDKFEYYDLETRWRQKLEDTRNEREDEFAPPLEYSNNQHLTKSRTSTIDILSKTKAKKGPMKVFMDVNKTTSNTERTSPEHVKQNTNSHLCNVFLRFI